MWGALVDGVEQCSNFSTLSIAAVPSGTEKITMQVELIPVTEIALLFLAMMFHRG